MFCFHSAIRPSTPQRNRSNSKFSSRLRRVTRGGVGCRNMRELNVNFSRDVRNVGHHGTGDLEVILRTTDDLGKAKHLIQRSYEES